VSPALCAACGRALINIPFGSPKGFLFICRDCCGFLGECTSGCSRSSFEREFDLNGNFSCHIGHITVLKAHVPWVTWLATGTHTRTPTKKGSPSKPDISDWRLWAQTSIGPGECACGVGLKKEDCRYHK